MAARRVLWALLCLSSCALASALPDSLMAVAPKQQSVIRSDNSPVCAARQPQCEARCKKGQVAMFVCSAGNGPQGGPYTICRCALPVQAVPAVQSAQLVLVQPGGWPGSKACNDKTWINDCTSQMRAEIRGSSVLLTPAVSAAFNEQCNPVPGIVIKSSGGLQAAVSFPQYPIGLTSTSPDGTLTIDFSTTQADDPNRMDWSQCVITYKIIQGSFLPSTGGGRQARTMAAAAAAAANAGGAPAPWHALQLLAAAAAALLALALQL